MGADDAYIVDSGYRHTALDHTYIMSSVPAVLVGDGCETVLHRYPDTRG